MRLIPSSFPTKYLPVVVTDWGQLNADIDAFIQSGSLAGETIKGYEREWSNWTAHCERLGVEPLAAPYDAFTAYLMQPKRDGSPCAAPTVLLRLSAIAHYYGEHTEIPAYELPENIADWKILRRGLKRADQERRRERGVSAVGDENVEPMMRNDLVTLLSAAPHSDARQNAVLAAVLLSFDHGLSAETLARLRAADVAFSGARLSIAQMDIRCDHRQRIRGVPWDCTACAVRVVLAEHSGLDLPLLHHVVGRGTVATMNGRLSQRLNELRSTDWRGATFARPELEGKDCRLEPADTLGEWQLAGLRRACVLRVGPHQRGQLLRGRAWASLAWSGGFRMCGDLLRLDRSHIRREPAGGWTVDLSNAKDDPFGSKAVTRSFGWPEAAPSDEDDFAVVRFLTEYLCVRDAVQGDAGMLFRARPLSPSEMDVPISAGSIVAASDLAELVKLAGLSGHHYTSKSCRKGFATQALEDGWAPEDVRDALRHLRLGTTLSHYVARASAGKTVLRLHQMVANAEESR